MYTLEFTPKTNKYIRSTDLNTENGVISKKRFNVDTGDVYIFELIFQESLEQIHATIPESEFLYVENLVDTFNPFNYVEIEKYLKENFAEYIIDELIDPQTTSSTTEMFIANPIYNSASNRVIAIFHLPIQQKQQYFLEGKHLPIKKIELDTPIALKIADDNEIKQMLSINFNNLKNINELVLTDYIDQNTENTTHYASLKFQ